MNWKNIVAVSAACDHIIGLTGEGSVVAAGDNKYGQCNVYDWSEIIEVSAARTHTVGLRTDGTVIAVGNNEWGQCNTHDWSGVVMVGAGYDYTVALRADGTVVATGDAPDGLSDWVDIISIAASDSSIIGLKVNGTVEIVGSDTYGQCSIREWDDVVAITAGNKLTAVLRANGEIWRTEIAPFSDRKRDTFVRGLKVFKNFETFAEDSAKGRNLMSQYTETLAELVQVKGLFSGSKRRELENRLAQIKEELSEL